MKVNGKCHCGEITYQAEVDPLKVLICHCTDCQNITGTAYRVSVPAPESSFKLLSGKPTIYVKSSDSGNFRHHYFCPKCGSQLYATNAKDTHWYTIRVGALAERHDLAPKRQIFYRSALPWATQSLEALPKSSSQ